MRNGMRNSMRNGWLRGGGGCAFGCAVFRFSFFVFRFSRVGPLLNIRCRIVAPVVIVSFKHRSDSVLEDFRQTSRKSADANYINR